MLKKFLDNPNDEKLKKLQNYAHNLEKEAKKIDIENKLLKIKIGQPDKNNENTKRENILLKKAFEKINKLFPEEISVIIQEIGVENQR